MQKLTHAELKLNVDILVIP